MCGSKTALFVPRELAAFLCNSGLGVVLHDSADFCGNPPNSSVGAASNVFKVDRRVIRVVVFTIASRR